MALRVTRSAVLGAYAALRAESPAEVGGQDFTDKSVTISAKYQMLTCNIRARSTTFSVLSQALAASVASTVLELTRPSKPAPLRQSNALRTESGFMPNVALTAAANV